MTLSGAPPWIQVVHGAATDTGQVRAHNEDAFGINPEQRVFVVADGLGGHQAGEVASAVAVERFLEAVADPATEGSDPIDVLTSAVDAAHRTVRQVTAEAPKREGMGTTIVGAWFPRPGTKVWLVNVGDSRGYLLRNRALTQLSVDHTAVELMRRAHALPKDPALWPPRQQLTQALGPSELVVPEVTSVTVETGDRVLLCSDGLTDMVAADEIVAVLDAHPDPDAATTALVQTANRAGGIDNITVVLLEVRHEEGGGGSP